MNLKLTFSATVLLLISQLPLQASEASGSRIDKNLYSRAGSIYNCTSGIKPTTMEVLNLFLVERKQKDVITDIELTTNLKSMNTVYFKVQKNDSQSFDGQVEVYKVLNSSEYSGFQISFEDLDKSVASLNLTSKNNTTLFKCKLAQ